MILDTLYHLALIPSQFEFTLVLMALGRWKLSRDNFATVCWILLVSNILNISLKNYFQVPLLSTVHHSGYAFPSGHMQMSTVFYSTLCLFYRNRWMIAISLILAPIIGYGLVYFHYHTFTDVIGGLGFGLFFAGSMTLMHRYFPLAMRLATFALATLIMGLSQDMPSYAWLYYHMLWLLAVIELCYPLLGDRSWLMRLTYTLLLLPVLAALAHIMPHGDPLLLPAMLYVLLVFGPLLG